MFYCSPCPTAAPPALPLLPLPYRCSGIPEYACCVNKRRQNVGLQTWIWRHKPCMPSNNDHHTPLLNTRIWKGGIQSSNRPGRHQNSARHWLLDWNPNSFRAPDINVAVRHLSHRHFQIAILKKNAVLSIFCDELKNSRGKKTLHDWNFEKNINLCENLFFHCQFPSI